MSTLGNQLGDAMRDAASASPPGPADRTLIFRGMGNAIVDRLQFPVIYGSGPPSGGIGDDGDLYVDLDNGNLYSKAAGVWTLTGNIGGDIAAVAADLAAHIADTLSAHAATAIPFAPASGIAAINVQAAIVEAKADSEATAAAALGAHVIAADPHPQYQRESEKGQPFGYPGLDDAQHVNDFEIAPAIARYSQIGELIDAHELDTAGHPLATATDPGFESSAHFDAVEGLINDPPSSGVGSRSIIYDAETLTVPTGHNLLVIHGMALQGSAEIILQGDAAIVEIG